MRYHFALLGLLALPALAQDAAAPVENWDAQRAQAKEMRSRAKDMRTAASRKFQEAEAACWKKVLVSSCRTDARQQKHEEDRAAKEVDIEAGRLERQVQAHEHDARAARRQAEAPQRQEDAARRAEEIRSHTDAALKRQADKQADIDRREGELAIKRHEEAARIRQAKKQAEIERREAQHR